MKTWDDKYIEIERFDLYVNGQGVVSVRPFQKGFEALAYLGSSFEKFYVDRKPLDEVKKEVEAWYAEKVRAHLVELEAIVQKYKDQLEALGMQDSLEQQIQAAKSQVMEPVVGSGGKERAQDR